MSMSLATQHAPINMLTIADLQNRCTEEQARYHRSTPQESVCCLEIVRRAAAHDDDAFAALIEASRPTILRRCPTALRNAQDDLAQEVASRLFLRLYRGEPPFQVTTFAAYVVYLKLTCASATQTLRGRQAADESLDLLHNATGYEPIAPQCTDVVDRRMLLERWLELLPSPAHREAFRRRFALDQSPDEVAQAMGVTKKEVFRLTEQAIRILKNLPEVREMLEA
ncbi:MAG: sigma-70 family RNA polymerase sigma factor [Oscillochloris sp.]|nr:sigma-70 family RNA polymerase sigma factor [Oscillochloris sp.]